MNAEVTSILSLLWAQAVCSVDGHYFASDMAKVNCEKNEGGVEMMN